MEDAEPSDFIQTVSESPVEDDAEKEQDGAAQEQLGSEVGFGGGAGTVFEGNGERGSRDENEEGEDEVVKVESIPCGMCELVGDELGGRKIWGDSAEQSSDSGFESENPQHVEPSEGVDRWNSR